MKLNEYIEQEQEEIDNLKLKLEEIEKKIIRFGFGAERKLLIFMISKKEKMINELKGFKKELVRFKE